MKKVILSMVALATFGFASAQEQTAKGKWLIEANTGFGGQNVGSTGFSLSSSDGNTDYNLGAEGGYFIMQDLAVKVGLGYGGKSRKINAFDGTSSTVTTSTIGYKIGAKYYVIHKIPVELSINGASVKDATENPLWLGIQGGYAIFLSDKIALEPGLRYNHSLNDKYTDKGVIQFNVGFSMFF
jgi:hypothetical protein